MRFDQFGRKWINLICGWLPSLFLCFKRRANQSSFEDKVTQGLAQWFTQIIHDPVKNELVIGLTHEPMASVPQRVLRFSGVLSVDTDWQDRDDECMETLLGADEEEFGSVIRYVLFTDQREIVIKAETKATISVG